MSANASTGSPPTRTRSSVPFVIHEDSKNIESTESTRQIGSMNEAMLHLKMNDDGEKTKHAMTKSDGPSPLLTSKLENVQAPASNRLAGNKVRLPRPGHQRRTLTMIEGEDQAREQR